MIKKQIPDADLKALMTALRYVFMSPQHDVEFQAVYEAVMVSYSVQNRLFKAFTGRTRTYVDVVIRKRKKRLNLVFSGLPDFAVNEVLADAAQSVKTEIVESVPVQQIEQDIALQCNTTVELQNVELEQSPQKRKRKGRGKAKKQGSPRSLVSVLIDDLDISKLEAFSDKYGLNFSQAVRFVIKRYFERE